MEDDKSSKLKETASRRESHKLERITTVEWRRGEKIRNLGDPCMLDVIGL